MNPTDTRAPTVLAVSPVAEAPVMTPIIVQEPPIPTAPKTRAPTGFKPVFIEPTPYQRVPTALPQEEPTATIIDEDECNDTGDCQIIANFPSLREFLCFDVDLGIAPNCALSCGVCGNTTANHCVDDKSAYFFVNDYWGHQTCKWLSTKAEFRNELCKPGEDGYHHCPRLCGRCDICQDDPGAAIFISYDIGYKRCSWLAKEPTYQSALCQPEGFGYKSCQKTCGRCSVVELTRSP